MKYLIVLFLLLPLWAHADCDSTTMVIQRDNQVTAEKIQTCNRGGQEVLARCQTSQWNNPWSQNKVGNSLECNWTESEAIQKGLTHVVDGVKIDWYDGSKRGYLMAWGTYSSQQGYCRRVVIGKIIGIAEETNNYIMCLDRERGWVPWRR